MSMTDFDGVLDQYGTAQQAPPVHLAFDPMINDMIIRLQQLESAIEWLRDKDTKMDPDVKDSVLANMMEEDEFCRAKLQQAWDNIPEFQAQGAPEDAFHPNQVIGNIGENEAFTEEVVVETAPKKRAPRKTAAKKAATKKTTRTRKKKDT